MSRTLPEALTVEEVAEALRLAPKTVRAMCSRGELRFVKVARRIRIPRSVLVELLEDDAPDVPAPVKPLVVTAAPRLRRPGRKPKARRRRG